LQPCGQDVRFAWLAPTPRAPTSAQIVLPFNPNRCNAVDWHCSFSGSGDHDATSAICGSISLAGLVALASVFVVRASMRCGLADYPEGLMLRAADGELCKFHARAPPSDPQGLKPVAILAQQGQWRRMPCGALSFFARRRLFIGGELRWIFASLAFCWQAA
jgi:hypothetical protein